MKLKLSNHWKTHIGLMIGVLAPTLCGWILRSPEVFLCSLICLIAGGISYAMYKDGEE